MKVVTLETLRHYDGKIKNDRMAKDGSNYVSGLQLVTPVIDSYWSIKNQAGVEQYTSKNKSLTVEYGAKVDYSGTLTCPAIDRNTQCAPITTSGDFGNILPGHISMDDIIANRTFKATFTAPKSGLEVENNKVVRAEGNQTTTAQASVAFTHRRYWGVSADANADIKAFFDDGSELRNVRAKNINFDCSGGKYFYYAYPKVLGNSTWTVGGLAFSGYTRTEKTITNEYGLDVVYYVYRSESMQTGSNISVVIS